MLKLWWILKRIFLLIFVIWGITTLVFIIMWAVPRNPALAMSGSLATPEQIEKFNQRWGLDRPIHIRYVEFYQYLLKGDLGTSIRTERPVAFEIKNYFPATFELATSAIIIALLIGVPLGLLSAIKRGKVIDQFTRVISLIGVSTPNFWLGLLLLLLFYFFLGWAGPGRISSSELAPAHITGLYLLDSIIGLNWASFVDSLRHLVLPSIALGFFGIGIVTRMMRSSALEVLSKDYVKAARSRGLSISKVILRHVIKNAFIPVITVIGILYGAFLAGSIVIEVVFGWPGLGSFAFASILKADSPAILGVVLVISLFYSVVNLLVDIIYRFLDPRIGFK
jgi:peptide/nickel transport system permease protein